MLPAGCQHFALLVCVGRAFVTISFVLHCLSVWDDAALQVWGGRAGPEIGRNRGLGGSGKAASGPWRRGAECAASWAGCGLPESTWTFMLADFRRRPAQAHGVDSPNTGLCFKGMDLQRLSQTNSKRGMGGPLAGYLEAVWPGSLGPVCLRVSAETDPRGPPPGSPGPAPHINSHEKIGPADSF